MSIKEHELLEECLQQYRNHTQSIESLLQEAGTNLDKAQAIQPRKKILVVDDNPYIRDVLARLLEYEQFEVITAEDGRGALDRAASEHPDLIVIDFNMPHLDGAHVIRRLRNQAEFEEVPILAITAYGHYAASQSMQAGADRTMIKPLEADLLISSINEMLDQSKAA